MTNSEIVIQMNNDAIKRAYAAARMLLAQARAQKNLPAGAGADNVQAFVNSAMGARAMAHACQRSNRKYAKELKA